MRTALIAVAIVTAPVMACTSDDDAAAGSPDAVASSVSGSVVVSVPVVASTVTTTGTAPVSVPATSSVSADAATTVPPRPAGSTEDGLSLPEGDQPEVLGPLGSTEIEIDTDDGSVQIGAGEVPDIVPDEFPVPDGFVVQLATDVGDQAGFSGTSQLGFDDLVELYRTGLPEAGYEVTEGQFIDGRVAVFGFDGRDGAGQVAISSAPGGEWSVLVTFQR